MGGYKFREAYEAALNAMLTQDNTPGSLMHRGQPVDFLGRIGREGDVNEAGELAVNVIEAAWYGRHLHDLET